MSDAQEADFQHYLDGRRPQLEADLRSAREQVLATASMRGTLGSGATIRQGIEALEGGLSSYIAETISAVDRWAGDALPFDRARALAVDHLKKAIADLATSEMAYRVGSRRPPEGAVREMEALVSQAATKLQARLREFELGADRRRDPPAASVINIVHARDVVGGIQQGGAGSVQASSVSLSAEAIGASLDHLASHLVNAPAEILAEIEPETATIRSQLAKAAPNSTIVQESGRTIRSVLEGAAGGALGNAMSPGLIQALAAFTAAIGLS